jgi:hypothetical protein
MNNIAEQKSRSAFQADEIRFDEQKHHYFIGSKRMPSVSEILKAAGLSASFEAVAPDVLARAANFGTAVHKATELLDLGRLDFSTVAPAIIPYIEGWEKFKQAYSITKTECATIEARLFNRVYRYCGTADRIYYKGDSAAVIDIKTTAQTYPSMKLQTAAYAGCLSSLKSIERYAVLLNSDGGFSVEYHRDESDLFMFQAAASLWWWRKGHGLLKEEANG